MNANRAGMAERQPAAALLLSLVEEAIAESLAPPRTPRAPVPGPMGAEAFLADAAAFLAMRPDADALIRRLQAMVQRPAPPSPASPTAPAPALATEPAPAPATASPEASGSALRDG